MRLMVCSFLVLLSGCASQQQVSGFEQDMMSEIDCPGGVEHSYDTTVFSSDEPQNVGKTKVNTKCRQIDMRSDIEKQHDKR
jgi:hypothetical protein